MMSRKVKQQVNSAVNELDMNLANNYKDLAHKALKELDELVTKLNEEGQLKEKDYTKLRDKVFHTKIGVKLCSMAGGGVSRNLWNFFRTAPAGTGQAVTCSTSGMGLRLK